MKVRQMLDMFVIPDQRRDLTSLANVRWLLRNLGVLKANRTNPLYPKAIAGLKVLVMGARRVYPM